MTHTGHRENRLSVGDCRAAQAAPIFIATYVASMFFPALDSIVKEKAFGDAKEKLGGKQLDIFVVNSYSSGFQVRLAIISANKTGYQNFSTKARRNKF